MFPIRDENPTIRIPYATYLLIAINCLVWVFVQGLGAETPIANSLCAFGLVPGDLLGNIAPGTRIPLGPETVCEYSGDGNLLPLLSSMFMHGGWMHIIGNMWFLYVFGDNVEDVMGPYRFVIFYLLCGFAAAAAQIVSDPDSTIPMVGASGAIGGVMGAYALLYPKTRVHTLIFLGFFITTISVPAVFMLGYWFVIQLMQGIPAIGSGQGGVAFWAHIGGFVAGVTLVHLLKHPEYYAEHLAQPNQTTAKHRWF